MNYNILRGEIVAKYKTQNAFAKHIGWHPNKVSLALSGQYKLDTDDIPVFVQALDMTEEVFCKIFLPMKSPNGDK